MRAAALAGILVVGAGSSVAAAGHADRVFLNGKIWTGDDEHPAAEALAIGGDTILAIGSTEEIRGLVRPDTAVVDLKGLRVVPGFQDSHLHFPGPSVNAVRLDGLETVAAIQRRLSEFARSHPGLRWITGGGWGYSAFPNQTADKKYIDAAIADRPVYVQERDGHMGLANSKALQMAGVTRDTANPPNGHIMKDAHGEPTGELKEAAQQLVFGRVPSPTAQEVYETLLQHMDEAAALGLTSVQNASWSREDEPVYNGRWPRAP